MNTSDLQRLKMAWLAAKEAGDTHMQLSLLQDHPGDQAALIDFIAAFHATGGVQVQAQEASLLPLTQRALQTSLERVFAAQTATAPVAAANLVELRKVRSLSKLDVAKGLRLTVDVWNKFENGAIELASLSQRQVERVAQFFQVSAEQFGNLLGGSQPSLGMNRRQTRAAAHNEQQGLQKQSFAEAIARSTMLQEDKDFWQEL